MYQVDATAESIDELDARLEEIWDGQPSLAGAPRGPFDKSKEALADLIDAGALVFPMNVTLAFQERIVHPSTGFGEQVTPGSVTVTIREVA